MKIKTNVKAGGRGMNHNERLNNTAPAAGLNLRTNLNARSRGAAIALTAFCMLSAPAANACGTGTQSGFTAQRALLSVLGGVLAPESPAVEENTKRAKDAANDASIVGMWKVTFRVGGAVWDLGFEQFYSDGNEITNDTAAPPALQNICWGVWKQMGGRTVKLKHLGWNFDASGTLTGTFVLTATITVDPQGNTYTGSFVADILDLSNKIIPAYHAEGVLKATRVSVD